MASTSDVRTRALPPVVAFAAFFLILAFAIAPLRVAMKYNWTHLDRVALIAILSVALSWLFLKALLKARKWAWWLVVVGMLSRAVVVVLDLAVFEPGRLTQAVHGFGGELLGAQYAFEFAVLVLVLHPEARRWFGVGVGAQHPTSGVA